MFIVAINEAGDILLQRNWRYTLDKELWEIPGGHVDLGEDPLDAAKRELLEESGLVSEHWDSLGEMFAAVGVANIRQFIYVARDVQRVDADTDEDESIIDQQFIKPSEVRKILSDYEILSAGDALALYRYLK